jgi:hypothetical protein
LLCWHNSPIHAFSRESCLVSSIPSPSPDFHPRYPLRIVLLCWRLHQHMHLRVNLCLSVSFVSLWEFFFPVKSPVSSRVLLTPRQFPLIQSRVLLTHSFSYPHESPVRVSVPGECITPMDRLFFVDQYSPQRLFLLHAYICIMRSLRDQNLSHYCYLSPFYCVEMKILTFTSPARMTLNRGIYKTPILSLRSLMASCYCTNALPQGSYHVWAP